MATWPASGDTDWNTKMLAYLAIEHETDGTHGAITPTSVAPLSLGSTTELTISSGAITVTRSFHTVDTESDAATDNLDTISGGLDGGVLIISAENDARTVVAKDATGNLRLAGDLSLTARNDTLMLIYNGTVWQELSRSTNA